MTVPSVRYHLGTIGFEVRAPFAVILPTLLLAYPDRGSRP